MEKLIIMLWLFCATNSPTMNSNVGQPQQLSSDFDPFQIKPLEIKSKKGRVYVKSFFDQKGEITKITADNRKGFTRTWTASKIDSIYTLVKNGKGPPGYYYTDSSFHSLNCIQLFRTTRSNMDRGVLNQTIFILERISDSMARFTMFGGARHFYMRDEQYVKPEFSNVIRDTCFSRQKDRYAHTVMINLRKNGSGVFLLDVTGQGFNSSLFWMFYTHYFALIPEVINRNNPNLQILNELKRG